MSYLTYQDFELDFETNGDGYRVTVTTSNQRKVLHTFNSGELEALRKLREQTKGGDDYSVRLSATAKGRIQLGSSLFKLVFAGEMLGCLRSSLEVCDAASQGLRLEFRFTHAPELATLPWEYLRDPSCDRFLALSEKIPISIVRFLDRPECYSSIPFTLPLRILVVVSLPLDYPTLEVEAEWEQLRKTLAPLERQGRLSLVRLESATYHEFQAQLRRTPYHILHFIGHGSFNAQTKQGTLFLQDEMGYASPLNGQALGTLLQVYPSLRLVFLNTCESGRLARQGLLTGVSAHLIQQGIPAVVAMQEPMVDQTSIVLAREFYGDLIRQGCVELALGETRPALEDSSHNAAWGSGVVYLCAPDGRLFAEVSSETSNAAEPTPAGKTSPPLPRPIP